MPSRITVERAATLRPVPAAKDLSFGTQFSDHMFIMDYHEGQGWHDPRIVPFADFHLSPASCVLHYGQAIFDGLKGFHGDDGVVRLFRPEAHIARLNRSAGRLCMPPLDPALVLESLTRLVDIDRRWVPTERGTSIYLRPTVIATENFLGVRPAKSYRYFVILSPVGAYYAEGSAPVRILASEDHTRAVRGGLGAAKTAANYAASLYAAELAHKAGFTQVLWLDGVEHRYLEEVGTMNIMVKIGGKVLTPPLSDSILAGVTRDSVLSLLRSWGETVEERPIAIDEIQAAARDGTLEEIWGTGTAAVISPVGEINWRGEALIANDGKAGPLTRRLYDAITSIQYGTTAHNDWALPVLPA